MSEENTTLTESLTKLRELGSDGFQWSDLAAGAKLLMDEVHDLSTADECEAQDDIAEALCAFLDETDTPWLPDSVADPVMKMLIPGLVKTLWDTAKENLFKAPPTAAEESPEA